MIRLLIIISLSLLGTTAEETTIIPDFTTIVPDLTTDMGTYVNCGHAERLLQVDATQYNVGTILDICWRRGVTLDELASGIVALPDLREDIEKYGFSQLYVPCEDVFGANLTRLTTSLLQDYVDCVARGAINENLQTEIDERFDEILQVYNDGNSSVTVDESTLVSCANASQRITLLCREYGLTGDQWSRGFLRYHHNDKWAVEEEVSKLSLGCDRVFNTRLHEDVYKDFLTAFVKCQATLGVESEVRDGIEKSHAKELMQLRGKGGTKGAYDRAPRLDSSVTYGIEKDKIGGLSHDLRGYVSCRHLIPVNVGNGAFSASWYAYDQCRVKGLTYEELSNGTIARDEYDSLPNVDDDIKDMYVKCESVFNEELWSFTTGLIKDYVACKEVGEVDKETRMMIQKKFAKMFELLATKRPTKKLKTIAQDLIPCSNFTGTLANECRRRGSTLAQELRGIGSLAVALGDKWLNNEPLDKLYVRCDDVFDKFMTYLDDVPLEKFIHCRWQERMSEEGVAYINMRINHEYKNDWKINGTRYIGDADVQISQTILFSRERVPREQKK